MTTDMKQCQDQSGSNAALSVGLSQDEQFNLGEYEQANVATVRPWRKLEGPYNAIARCRSLPRRDTAASPSAFNGAWHDSYQPDLRRTPNASRCQESTRQ